MRRYTTSAVLLALGFTVTLAACGGGDSGDDSGDDDSSGAADAAVLDVSDPEIDAGDLPDAPPPAADAAPDAFVGTDGDMDGVTVEAGDCNDADGDVAPGKTEVCDGKDNDCNMMTDEGFDTDGDGFTSCAGDCDPMYDGTYPGAPEACDFSDNDCNGMIDEGLDTDMDGFNPAPCGTDCQNGDDTVYPGAPELADGKDNDCNGGIDEPFTDNDGDGFNEQMGDCADDDPLVNPGAIEVGGDMVDNDCDGMVDEPLAACDGAALSSANPFDYAKAIGLCNGEVVNAQFVGGVAQSRSIATSFGTFAGPLATPVEGTKLAILSSGNAGTAVHDPGVQFDNNNNTLSCTSTAHPAPGGDPGVCGDADPATVCDYTEVRLTIKVPTNAKSFKYRFQFYSSEYPTWRCSAFDDTFLALLQSQAFTGNISFDSLNHPMSINVGFFDVCFTDNAHNPPNVCTINPVAPLAGTGFDPQNGGQESIGAGATTVLTTTAPVVPGETITLRFVIFDEGDDILDSNVVIDGFEWSLQPSSGPVTQ